MTKPRHHERQPLHPRPAAARHPHRLRFQVGLEVTDRAVAQPDRFGFLEQPLRVLAPAIRTAVRSAPARHAHHLDPAPALGGLHLYQCHFEILQPEIAGEIIPRVLVHPSGPPPFSEEERSWMNQDVSWRQAPRINSPPLLYGKLSGARKLMRAANGGIRSSPLKTLRGNEIE